MNHCGKMKLLLRSLLLCSLCAPSSWSVSSDRMTVKQTPDVSVLEGEPVTITCCWMGNTERFRVNWLKNQTFIKNETYNKPQEPVNQQANSCSTLVFPCVSRQDSGRYVCRVTVEIPEYYEAEGNGTIITVTATEHTGVNTDLTTNNKTDGPLLSLPVIITLGVVVPLFVISLICFCSLRRNSEQAARVIYEVPHIDSETIEMDKHSTGSSRGSTQWVSIRSIKQEPEVSDAPVCII